MKLALMTFAALVALGGCATIRRSQAQDTETLLAAAGFTRQGADATSATEATPPYRLVSRTTNGAVQYVYADPENCRCVYAGGPREYAEFQRLAIERRNARERLRRAEDSLLEPYQEPWWLQWD